jgi:hypothetical protein
MDDLEKYVADRNAKEPGFAKKVAEAEKRLLLERDKPRKYTDNK